MKRDEILFLNQLVKSLVETEEKLEGYNKRKNIENYNKTKKAMLKIQEEIAKLIK